MKRTNAGKQRKFLAARVLCGLLLGAYLTAGYCLPVVWGADNAEIHGKDVNIAPEATAASAWGYSTVASGDYATAWGVSYIDSTDPTKDQ